MYILFKLLLGQCSKCTNILQVHFLSSPEAPSPLLKKFKHSKQTDRQSCCYTKDVKGCLSCEIVGVEHDTLISLLVSPVSRVIQNTHFEKISQHIKRQAIRNSEYSVAFFYVSPHSFSLF